MLHNSIIMAQQDRYLNMALPLVNCLKLVRGFAVWFVGPEVCVGCMCGLCGVPYWCLQSCSAAFVLVSGYLAAMRVRSIQASGRFVIAFDCVCARSRVGAGSVAALTTPSGGEEHTGDCGGSGVALGSAHSTAGETGLVPSAGASLVWSGRWRRSAAGCP